MFMTVEPYPLRGGISVPEKTAGEGNWLLGAYWLAAGALGGVIRVENLPEESAQPEKSVVPLLYSMGCAIDRRGGAVRATHRPLCAPRVTDLAQVPSLVPVIAVVACFSRVITEIHFQVREKERMRRLRGMLAELGGVVRETEEGLIVRGITLRGGNAGAGNDPYLAMAAAVAASVCGRTVTIEGAECIQELYPDFFRDYRRLGGRFTLSERRQ